MRKKIRKKFYILNKREMAKQKYDRPALKLEYFQSDIEESTVFIEQKFGKKMS